MSRQCADGAKHDGLKKASVPHSQAEIVMSHLRVRLARYEPRICPGVPIAINPAICLCHEAQDSRQRLSVQRGVVELSALPEAPQPVEKSPCYQEC